MRNVCLAGAGVMIGIGEELIQKQDQLWSLWKCAPSLRLPHHISLYIDDVAKTWASHTLAARNLGPAPKWFSQFGSRIATVLNPWPSEIRKAQATVRAFGPLSHTIVRAGQPTQFGQGLGGGRCERILLCLRWLSASDPRCESPSSLDKHRMRY